MNLQKETNSTVETEVNALTLKTGMNDTRDSIVSELTSIKTSEITEEEIKYALDTIDVSNLSTINKFGEDAATSLGKTVDNVIRSTNLSELNEVGKTMTTLTKLMKSLDMKELTEEPKAKGLSKLFGGLSKQIEKILDKYTTVGDEIENIYVELKNYERDIEKTNNTLNDMYITGVNFYKELSKYIIAGQKGMEILDAELDKLKQSNDGNMTFRITEMNTARNLLEQRVYDLQTASVAAMQAIPMLKTSMFSNAVLSRKINSAFIVTLPVFKQAVAQAVLRKKQQLQSDSLKALDDCTNEMIKRNAEMMVAQGKDALNMAYNSSIKVDTLVESRDTILRGMEELQQLQDTLKEQRKEELRQLEAMK